MTDNRTNEPTPEQVEAAAMEMAIIDLPSMHSLEDRVLAREKWRRYQWEAERVLGEVAKVTPKPSVEAIANVEAEHRYVMVAPGPHECSCGEVLPEISTSWLNAHRIHRADCVLALVAAQGATPSVGIRALAEAEVRKSAAEGNPICEPGVTKDIAFIRGAVFGAAQGAAPPLIGRLDLARHYWRSQGYDYDLHGQDGNNDYEMGLAVADAALAALAAAQGAAPQAGAYDHCCNHPKCPGGSLCCCISEQRQRDCWNQWREEVAGDTKQAFRDAYSAGRNDPAPWAAAPVLPSSPESPAQAFADWHESWWQNEPNTIQKANAQAAFFAGWDARGAVPVLPSSGIDEDRAEAVREVARYIDRIAPNGLVSKKMILADIELAADRLGRGIHANGNNRAGRVLAGKGS